MFKLKKSLVALIAVLTLYSVEVRADSFTITDVQGVVVVNTSIDGGPPTLRLPPEVYHLGGPDLSLTVVSPFAWGGDIGNVEVRDTCITPCAPGMVLGTNSTFSGTLAQGAWAVINGVKFEFISLTGSLKFVSPPIVLPNFGTTVAEMRLPFFFSGDINGVGVVAPNPTFTATLSGQGVAIFRFEQVIGTDLLNPRYMLYSIEYHFGPIPISIDIKPATFPNSINSRSKGKIPVAILTTDFFDATAVDPTTVLFGATGIEVAPVHFGAEDVDGDGDIDMVFHFVTPDTGITCGSTSASLTGAMFGGHKIKGSDSIKTEGCN